MLIKSTASLDGLQPIMRKALRIAEGVWKEQGRPEGVTVTSATDGVHSAASWHYYGYAVDFRTGYSNKGLGDDIDAQATAAKLSRLLPEFDVLLEPTHIHVEISNRTARLLGVLF